jgi:hypothetical protein
MRRSEKRLRSEACVLGIVARHSVPKEEAMPQWPIAEHAKRSLPRQTFSRQSESITDDSAQENTLKLIQSSGV